jgi:uncharacterized membrane-anchored protein YhcB (DUF1043 family)
MLLHDILLIALVNLVVLVPTFAIFAHCVLARLNEVNSKKFDELKDEYNELKEQFDEVKEELKNAKGNPC